MRTLIRNAQVVLPAGVERLDVLVDGDTVARVGAPAGTVADEVVDATGLHLLPGVVDDQVHFREPGLTAAEDIHSGSLCCAKGGVTTFLDMPNTRPQTTTRELHAAKRAIGAATSVVNYGFYMGATTDNVAELAAADHAPGIKVFLGSSTGNMLVDDQEALERIFGETTLPIAAHCEDETTIRANAERFASSTDVRDHTRIRSAEAALIATRRAVDLAKRHAHRLHVLHVSTAAEVEVLRDHAGVITAEACPHHLLFNEADYDRLGTLGQMNPSLKTAEDNEGLWRGLLEGAVQVVATDHAPHLLEAKHRTYPDTPSGLPAVENSLALMLDQAARGRCALEDVVRWMCDAPARTWDMVGKGRIAEGHDADLVLVDLEARRTVRNEDQVTRCGWTPWDGVTLQGWPVRTWVLGRTVFADGELDPSVRGREVTFDHARGGLWATGGVGAV